MTRLNLSRYLTYTRPASGDRASPTYAAGDKAKELPAAIKAAGDGAPYPTLST